MFRKYLLYCTLYTVHCTLQTVMYTVHCKLYCSVMIYTFHISKHSGNSLFSIFLKCITKLLIKQSLFELIFLKHLQLPRKLSLNMRQSNFWFQLQVGFRHVKLQVGFRHVQLQVDFRQAKLQVGFRHVKRNLLSSIRLKLTLRQTYYNRDQFFCVNWHDWRKGLWMVQFEKSLPEIFMFWRTKKNEE